MWPPPVALRARHHRPCRAFVDLATLPSGYVQAIQGSSIPTPVLVSQRATSALIPSGVASRQFGGGQHLTPQFAPPGRVGNRLFGGGRFGLEREHPELLPVNIGGFTVWEPASQPRAASKPIAVGGWVVGVDFVGGGSNGPPKPIAAGSWVVGEDYVGAGA